MDICDDERAALDAALLRLGLDFEKSAKDRLLAHLKLVIERNRTLNLTRIDSLEEGIILHLEDSLSIYGEFCKDEGSFCDIGTGAGFPGLPLAIASGRPGVVLDSVKKKARAVQEFIQALGMEQQVQALGMRSEELAVRRHGEFQTVIARAVDRLCVVEEYAAPLLRFKGHLIAMRGIESSEDEKASQKASERLGLKLVSAKKIQLGSEGLSRSIYVYEKQGDPSVRLPRRPGMAHKHSLGVSD